MQSSDTLLLRALRGNALFSATSAGLLFLAAPWIAVQLGLPDPLPVYIVAALLVGFALQLANIVRSRQIRGWEVRGIIVADIGWVVATVILGSLYFRSLTVPGLILIDLVALAVLFFAIQQIRGLRAFLAARSQA